MSKSLYTVDPFTPDKPVNSTKYFIGRIEEIKKCLPFISGIKANNPKNLIITGPRGIGKSSILLQIKGIAEGDNALLKKINAELPTEPFDFITSWTDILPDQNPKEIAEGITREFLGVFSKIFEKIDLGIDLGGYAQINFRSEDSTSLGQVIEKFCNDVAKISKQAIKQNKDGVIFFIDELDQHKKNSGLGSFFKIVHERLARSKITNVAFFGGGITGAIQELAESHGSANRTFIDQPIEEFNEAECFEILHNLLATVKISIDRKITDLAYAKSAGFPEPIHLLGSEFIKVDTDNIIDRKDFEEALKNLVSTIRKNHLGQTLKSAGAGRYQRLLKAMAEMDSNYVTVAQMADKLGENQQAFSVNLGKLVDRRILDKYERGVYFFVDPLLKEYIRNFGVIQLQDDSENQTDK